MVPLAWRASPDIIAMLAWHMAGWYFRSSAHKAAMYKTQTRACEGVTGKRNPIPRGRRPTSWNSMQRCISWKAACQALFTRLYRVHSLTCILATQQRQCLHTLRLRGVQCPPLPMLLLASSMLLSRLTRFSMLCGANALLRSARVRQEVGHSGQRAS